MRRGAPARQRENRVRARAPARSHPQAATRSLLEQAMRKQALGDHAYPLAHLARRYSPRRSPRREHPLDKLGDQFGGAPLASSRSMIQSPLPTRMHTDPRAQMWDGTPAGGEVGLEVARLYQRHVDTEGCHFVRQRFAISLHGEFARAVKGLKGKGDEPA